MTATVALSDHFKGRKPSPIRLAPILFAKRPDKDRVKVVNTAIGNVSLPMHPAMQERMRNLGAPESPFADGVVKYTATVGLEETQEAFLHIIAAAGFPTRDLSCLITDGGSMSMELMVLGVCGPRSERPLLLLDPAYTNYMDMARRAGVETVSVRRVLGDDGRFAPPDLAALKQAVEEHRPRGLVVIPADNPTGDFINQEEMNAFARLCVEHEMWLISDEAYRQLQYGDETASSVWGISEAEVPGITGRRISIETASKVWNACGLRIGALVTDNPEFRDKAVAEFTANLSSNAIGQYIFGALAHVAAPDLDRWYHDQRDYYARMMKEVAGGLREALPGVIVSNPAASLYSVVDVRNVDPGGFRASEFVTWCASEGSATIDGQAYTLLVAPMNGFYGQRLDDDPSSRQMRVAYVEPPELMKLVPSLFAALFRAYGHR